MAKLLGGSGSNKIVQSRAPKVEPRSRAVNPGGVGQIGTSVGNHATGVARPMTKAAEPLFEGKGYSPPRGPTNMLAQGPGAGRTVMPCGSQSSLKPATQMPKGRGILTNE